MNFELSDEQTLLAETIKRFVATHYNFDARAKIIASPAGHSEDVWAALAEMGVLGLPFAETHGGFGGATVDVMLVMEAIGEGLLVEPYLATVGLGGRFVALAGTKAQQDRILPALIQGKHTLAFAHTEPGARYDLRQVGLRARRSGDGYTFDGEKRMVLHGGRRHRHRWHHAAAGASHGGRRVGEGLPHDRQPARCGHSFLERERGSRRAAGPRGRGLSARRR